MRQDTESGPPYTLRLFAETWGLYALVATPSLIALGCNTLLLFWYGLQAPFSSGHVLLGLLYVAHVGVLILPLLVRRVYVVHPRPNQGNAPRWMLFMVLAVSVIFFLVSTIVLWFVIFDFFCTGCYFG